LVNTFNSLVDVAEHHISWLPADKLMVNRLDSISKIGNYHGPVLQTHGDRDRVVPYEFALELFGAANSPKQFVMVPGGGHNDPLSEEFHEALDELLTSLPSNSGQSVYSESAFEELSSNDALKGFSRKSAVSGDRP
ncbi:MAG TPA: alpha/beta hydrolase, partial [Planctomycetaceae bacterium]|nr:alpha/beta hydrolase [Planctomycetaceae bacterium]